MNRSEAPAKALACAEKCVEQMRSAKTMSDLEDAWREFLMRIDRFWNKAEAHFSRSPKWGGWSGRYQAARSKDDLLLYIRQARNVEEHSIQPITDFRPGGFSIRAAAPGQAVSIELLRIENSVPVEYRGSPATIEFTAAKTELLPVTVRGRVYQPPISHLGQPLTGKTVLDLAQAAIGYYRTFLSTAEAELYK